MTVHPSEHGWVHETMSYNVDGQGFTVLAVGVVFIILLIIKNWRSQ